MVLSEEWDKEILAGNPYGSDPGDPCSLEGLDDMYVCPHCRQPGEMFYLVDENKMPDERTLQALREEGWKIKFYKDLVFKNKDIQRKRFPQKKIPGM